MPSTDDLDELVRVVRGIEALLQGVPYDIEAAAIGVMLTRFIAGQEPQRRERVLRMFMEGVRRDAPELARHLHQLLQRPGAALQ